MTEKTREEVMDMMESAVSRQEVEGAIRERDHYLRTHEADHEFLGAGEGLAMSALAYELDGMEVAS